MTLDYLPGREWQGVVDFIYPTLDENTRTIPVRLKFQNQDQALKPNMFAQVMIQHSESGRQVLLAPNESIIRSGVQDRVVLAMGEGRFKSVEVALGRTGDRPIYNVSNHLISLSPSSTYEHQSPNHVRSHLVIMVLCLLRICRRSHRHRLRLIWLPPAAINRA